MSPGPHRRRAAGVVASAAAMVVLLGADNGGVRQIDPPELGGLTLDHGRVASIISATGTSRPVVMTNRRTRVSGKVAEVLANSRTGFRTFGSIGDQV